MPPHMRNKQTAAPQPNIAQSERRVPRRSNEKPPWQIQKELEDLDKEKKLTDKNIEDTEANFPVLGNKIVPNFSSIWSGGRKFSELAAEWKTADEDEKERAEYEKNCKNDDVFHLPKFNTTRRFGEPEDEFCEDDEIPNADPPEEEWKVVYNRKFRKPKKIVDFDEDDINEGEKEDDTVWAGQEEHETCWDERKR